VFLRKRIDRIAAGCIYFCNFSLRVLFPQLRRTLRFARGHPALRISGADRIWCSRFRCCVDRTALHGTSLPAPPGRPAFYRSVQFSKNGGKVPVTTDESLSTPYSSANTPSLYVQVHDPTPLATRGDGIRLGVSSTTPCKSPLNLTRAPSPQRDRLLRSRSRKPSRRGYSESMPADTKACSQEKPFCGWRSGCPVITTALKARSHETSFCIWHPAQFPPA
jgi:hypothetical protein